MRRPPIAPLLVLALLGASLPARADRPLVTDAADIAERGRCKVEPGVGRLQLDGRANQTVVSLPLSCGLGWHSELGAEFARASGGGNATNAVQLAGKTGLRDGGEHGLSLAVGYRATWAEHAGEGWSREGASVYLAATQPLVDALTVHLNLGARRDSVEHRTRGIWALAVEWTPIARWTVAAERFREDAEPAWNGGGVRYQFTDQAAGSLAYHRRGGDPQLSLWTLGARVEF